MLAPLRDQIDGVAYYRWRAFERRRHKMIASRTGYTGELGFEIFVTPSRARAVGPIDGAGRQFGVAPRVSGARDTLRFEASLCLYGHELDDETTPLEAGLQLAREARQVQTSSPRRTRGRKREGLEESCTASSSTDATSRARVTPSCAATPWWAR
jgi:aminomethyltransferase